MVRMLVREPQLDDVHYVELSCLALDDKPTGYANGSLCLEVDTGDLYAYDEEGAEWNKIAELGGGS